jgi:hypothetical protein
MEWEGCLAVRPDQRRYQPGREEQPPGQGTLNLLIDDTVVASEHRWLPKDITLHAEFEQRGATVVDAQVAAGLGDVVARPAVVV